MKKGIWDIRWRLLLVFSLAVLLPSRVAADVGSSLRWAATSVDGMTGGVITGNVELRNPASLAGESLNETDFATHAKWDVTGDFVDSGQNCWYTHATGVGTCLQTSANGAIPWASSGINGWFVASIPVTSNSNTGTCTITTDFAATAQSLNVSSGTRTNLLVFQAKSTTVGAFTISCTSTGAASIRVDNVSLKQINGGNLTVQGRVLVGNGTLTQPGFSFLSTPSIGLSVVPGTAGELIAGSNASATWGSAWFGIGSNLDQFLTSPATATLQLGRANAAAPVAQTLQAQGSRAGTDTNVAGGNLTIASGQGTGNATGSSLIFQTPVEGGTGTAAETMQTRLTLSSGGATFSNVHAYSSLLGLTNATMNRSFTGAVLTATSAYSWTNAMVVALGASTTGDITVATLPAKTEVVDAQVVILTPDTSANALTVACGRTGATYIDYITAQDAKAAANTLYGDAAAERGTNLTGWDVPSYTATTPVVCHFVKTTTNLDTVLGSTGRVILTTRLLP